MAKKRTSLDSLFPTESAENEEPTFNTGNEREAVATAPEESKIKKLPKQTNEIQPKTVVKPKSEIIKQTVYLPSAVHEQLRRLAFEERKKMHDYLIEGLDRVFKDRGLKPYVELSEERN